MIFFFPLVLAIITTFNTVIIMSLPMQMHESSTFDDDGILHINGKVEKQEDLDRLIDLAETASEIIVHGCDAFLSVYESIWISKVTLANNSNRDNMNSLYKVIDLAALGRASRPVTISLHLPLIQINDWEAKHIGYDLFSKVNELYLGFNEIGDDGVAYLADASTLPNSVISVLHLQGNNNLGDQGLFSLCETIKSGDSSISELNVSENQFSIKGIRSLAGAAIKLTKLIMKENSINDDGAKSFANEIARTIAAASTNPTSNQSVLISHLDLSSNQIGVEGVRAIFSVLYLMPNLQYLDLCDNLGLTGIELEALIPKSSMVKVNL